MAGTDDQVLEASQKGRPLTVKIASLAEDILLPTTLIGHEAISSMFSFSLDLISQKPEDVVFDHIIGQNITISLRLADESQRFFNGFVSRIAQVGRDVGTEHRFTHYHVEVVPWLWFLTRIADCRIFQEKTVPEIVTQIFQERGFHDFQLNLSRTYTSWDYCVQYRESDFQFVSRLMEEEGIFYFFEHEDSNHTLVMADSPNVYKSCPGQSTAKFEPEGGIGEDQDTVTSWVVEQELHSGKVTNRDHHFEMPDKTLEFSESTRFNVAQNTKLELYDYPGGYAEKFNKPGERLDKVEPESRLMVDFQMEEQETPHLVNQGSSDCRSFTAGTKFQLENSPPGVGAGPYVLTSVQHSATQDASFVSGGEVPFDYSNTFSCLSESIVYRPRRITPKPTIAGPQTAVVVGPAGEEIFTDKFGRVKVQFHWDRLGKKDADSSCWIRVAQQWAGKRWGASFWPRIGQEVVVDFLEGDPDQPIIVGSVYNADQMPPYLGDGLDSKHKNDNKLTGVKSNTTKGGAGFNEWRFDDTKGKEQIFMHAERNMDVRVKNESMERVVANRHLIVGNEKDGKKSGDQKEKIFQDKHLHVLRHQQEKIEGNAYLTIGKGQADGGNHLIVIEKSRFEHIGDQEQLLVDGGQFVSIGSEQHLTVKQDKLELLKANSHLHVMANRNEKVDANQSLTVGGSQQEKVNINHALDAGMQIHLKAGMTVIIEAGMQLSLKVGGSFIDINPTGVTIQGPMVLINSGGAAGSGSGSSPTAPDDATPPEAADEAQPSEPAVADDSVTGSKSAPK